MLGVRRLTPRHPVINDANRSLAPIPTAGTPLELTKGSGVEANPDIEIEDKLKDAFDRGWSVIVWNDPINLMDYVVYIFKSVLKMNEQEASRHMWEVHKNGKSLVARETREKSEFFVHRLRAFGLNATLEHEN